MSRFRFFLAAAAILPLDIALACSGGGGTDPGMDAAIADGSDAVDSGGDAPAVEVSTKPLKERMAGRLDSTVYEFFISHEQP